MLVNYENTLSDIDNHWASEPINKLANNLILQGNPDGEYKPEASVTRAEVSAIIVRALGLVQGVARNTFTDAADNAWSAEAIQVAYAYGLIGGYTDGSFRPNANITREDAMVIMARMARMLNLTAQVDENILAGFSDTDQISGYARNAVALNVSLGIVNGNPNGTIAPKDELSRAEFAVLIERMLVKAGLMN